MQPYGFRSRPWQGARSWTKPASQRQGKERNSFPRACSMPGLGFFASEHQTSVGINKNKAIQINKNAYSKLQRVKHDLRMQHVSMMAPECKTLVLPDLQSIEAGRRLPRHGSVPHHLFLVLDA